MAFEHVEKKVYRKNINQEKPYIVLPFTGLGNWDITEEVLRRIYDQWWIIGHLPVFMYCTYRHSGTQELTLSRIYGVTSKEKFPVKLFTLFSMQFYDYMYLLFCLFEETLRFDVNIHLPTKWKYIVKSMVKCFMYILTFVLLKPCIGVRCITVGNNIKMSCF